MRFPVSQPSITQKEIDYVNEAVSSGWVSSNGPFIKKFEQAFAERHGFKYGVSLNSGTSALMVALQALGIKRPMDEVIVPDFTMVATALAPYHLAAKAVFVDCDDNLLIDLHLLKYAINTNTEAIMPVHVYGRRAPVEEIKMLAGEAKVVVDAAESHGMLPGGDAACFSFFGNKIMTTGEGGMFCTNDQAWAEEVNYLKNMAFEKEHTFLHQKAGHNMRMTNMQAALGLAQLERLDELLAKRAQVEMWYNRYLPKEVLMPSREVVWMYDIQVDPDHQEPIRKFLAEAGIETRLFFKPMTMQPMFAKYTYDLGGSEQIISPNALKWSKRGLYLPTYPDLTEKDIKYIAEKVTEYCNEYGI